MNFLFACGGTGGHIYPAIAVADRLKELFPDARFLFVGSDDSMERELVPRAGYEIRSVKASSFHRSIKPGDIRHNLKAVRRIAQALGQSRKIIREFRPVICIGTGGYVCYPVLRMANKLGIPTVVHESNAIPGLTTRLLEKRVDQILLGFSDSAVHYKHAKKSVFTGTPVRAGFRAWSKEEARNQLGFGARPVVLSVWGSSGALYMNEKTVGVIAANERKGDFTHIHVTGNGEAGLSYMTNALAQTGCEKLRNTQLHPYLYDMPKYMAAADLVVCRAGACTLNELASLGKPAILIPSPFVTANHQEKNARLLADRDCAVLIREKDCTAELLHQKILELLSEKDRLSRMSEAMKAMDAPDATEKIIRSILSLIQGNAD
jgi:UDP-N-acetylglucosamine--N-acetylmuramyl-(pentapeptide) pyrophosphoryl-undecaprenol N-acetylglucosamine transferase